MLSRTEIRKVEFSRDLGHAKAHLPDGPLGENPFTVPALKKRPLNFVPD